MAEAADRLRLGSLALAAVDLVAGLRRRLALPHALVAADDVDVDGDRHALVDGRGPERVVGGRDALAPRRPVRDHHAIGAARLRLPQAVDGRVDPERRDLGHADETRRVGRAELLEQEVVVRLDAGEHEVGVLVPEEMTHRALRLPDWDTVIPSGR